MDGQWMTLLASPEMLKALLAGFGVAAVCGVLGCFVVWRRMAYFGDALSHAALLGIALGLLLEHTWNIGESYRLQIGVFMVCAAFAVLLIWLQHKRIFTTDTLLGIFANSGLSLGMVVLSMMGRHDSYAGEAPHGEAAHEVEHMDVHNYLFGDLLGATMPHIVWIYVIGAVVLVLLIRNWAPLVLMTIHEDLAQAEGVKQFHMQVLLMGSMTLVVAVSIQMIGVLLMTAMLVIPAASARQLTRSPESMAWVAVLLGMVAMAGGLLASMLWHTPSSPSIVTLATMIFALLLPVSRFIRR